MGILHDYLPLRGPLSSDCRETPNGCGAERQHAMLGAAIEAM